jgi:Uma2 family endonuclease
VKDVTNQLRNSWVVWEEDGRYPNLIIELLSDSTSKTDRTLKKRTVPKSLSHSRIFLVFPKYSGVHGLSLDRK